MPMEYEIKLRYPDLAAVRARLGALGATSRGTVCERNELYDTPAGRLRSADCGLRLRIERPATPSEMRAGACDWTTGAPSASATLTFKGPRQGGAVKAREEFETTVGDAATLRALLARLDYAPVVVYEKLRETWVVRPAGAAPGDADSCNVTLDTLPVVGTWLEIEGPDATAVLALQRALGLEQALLEKLTYVEMAATQGRADAAGCRHLIFGHLA